ncbi:hypothetical protein CLIB1444_02S03730 [[Candida] jaroonii]|uniref:Uncharacterized protein n=1 Tax=[Candida] jaroonii TaxID=467808 RepID=A0ACA9Y2N7_9ASCO|nr:hypothetical protein CLIB1444_02S03730 [[Candida] jaroonii]
MAIKLSKRSEELDREVNEKFVEAPKKLTSYLLITLVLSVIIFIQNLYLLNDSTNPQFQLVMKKGNNDSEEILSTMKNSLLMVSFLAHDFKAVSLDTIENIDTFDAGTKYDLYYNGYGKYEFNSSEISYFRETNGLDIFEDLINDVAVQVSGISKSNTTALVNPLMRTFTHTVGSVSEMYDEYKATGDIPEHFNEDTLKLGRSANNIEKFAKFMKNYPQISIIISFISTLSLFVLVNVMLFRNDSKRLILAVVFTESFQTICLFCSWASQYRYYYKLNKVLTRFNLAKLTIANGYTFLQIMLILSFTIQAIWIYNFCTKKN